MTGPPNSRDWFWNRYWQFNRVASCYDRVGSNYPDDFFREWRGFFEALPERAEILDVCTGNGAIARFAARLAREQHRNHRILAVDRAAIDPLSFAPEQGLDGMIEFRPGVAAESLPFSDDRFDAVTSQYGLEYTDRERSLAEVARVLKPGAHAKIICHAKEGEPIRDAETELKRIAFVIDELRLFDLARRAVRTTWEAELQGRAPDLDSVPAVAEFSGALRRLERAKAADPSPYYESAHGLLTHTVAVRRAFALPELLGKINDIEMETLAHRGRLLTLTAAALSEAECRAWAKSASAFGLSDGAVHPFRVGPGGQLAGWVLAFMQVA